MHAGQERVMGIEPAVEGFGQLWDLPAQLHLGHVGHQGGVGFSGEQRLQPLPATTYR